jgi:hypothetical protein
VHNYDKDRRYARHGSNIIDTNDKPGLFKQKRSIYDTAIVLDYVADPIDFLAEEILLKLDDPSSISKKSFDDEKENLRKLKKFSTNMVMGENQENINNANLAVHKNYTRLEAYTMQNSPLKLINHDLVSIMPRNSIIALNITKGNRNKKRAEVFFPFFSSHLGLPVKPGEQVWCFYENINGSQVGYWISRKVGPLPVEDANYTHLDRSDEIESALNILNAKGSTVVKEKIIKNKFKNFANSIKGVGQNTSNLENIDYDDIITESKSYKEEFIGQAVPRYSKGCGDLILQGSNNTLISMSHGGSENKGTITLSAGRKISSQRIVKNSRSTRAKSFEHQEEDKSTDIINYQNIKVKNVIAKVKKQESDLESSSAMIRVSEDGSIVIKNEAGASISLMSSGNIVIKPSKTGLLKLGGDDASQAILGTKGFESVPGNILAPAIVTSAGGKLGSNLPPTGSPGQYATKILVK